MIILVWREIPETPVTLLGSILNRLPNSALCVSVGARGSGRTRCSATVGELDHELYIFIRVMKIPT